MISDFYDPEAITIEEHRILLYEIMASGSFRSSCVRIEPMHIEDIPGCYEQLIAIYLGYTDRPKTSLDNK